MSQFQFKYLNESKVKQLQDIVYKTALQRKYQSQQEKKPEIDAIDLVEKFPDTHLKLCRSANEQPTEKQKPKPCVIIEKTIKQQSTVEATVRRQVVIPNKVILNKKIPLKKPENSDSILAKITLSQQAICSSVDQIIPNLVESKVLRDEIERKKLQNRFRDFLKMFTRNYMYQIEKSIDSLRSSQPLTQVEFSSKVCSLFNILQIALSTYVRGLRNFVDKGVPDKAIQLLQSVQHAMESCVQRKIFDENDVVIKTIIEKIEDTLFRIQNIDLLKLLLKNNDIQRYMHNFERLSMYEPKTLIRAGSINKTNLMRNRKISNDSKISKRGDRQQFNGTNPMKNSRTSKKYSERLLISPLTSPAIGNLFDRGMDRNHEKAANSIADSTNRTKFDDTTFHQIDIVKDPEEEIFKSNNVKYTKVISNKQHVLNIDETESKKSLKLNPKDHQFPKNEILRLGKDKKLSSKLLLRVSEEINLSSLKQVYKNLDIGERLFIEKFLELETRL